MRKHWRIALGTILFLIGTSAMAVAADFSIVDLTSSISENAAFFEATEGGDTAHHAPPAWSVIPFAILLIMIATGPIFYEHFWHHNYPKIAVALAVIVVAYYLFGLHNTHGPIHAFFEYFQFIALLSSLYIASGGIMIKVDKEGTPFINVVILVIGAFISNIIGTTGASMLLIRPFIRLNQARIQPYHVVFFIFIVSNVGGSLTPIGDPPLFLGFLKGVPFEWTFIHNIVAWALAIGLLSGIFYFFDHAKSKKEAGAFDDEELPEYTGRVSIMGSKNFLWLGVVIGAVFLDPIKIDWIPGILEIHGHGWTIGTLGGFTEEELQHVTAFSFVRELIMFSVAFLSYRLAEQDALKGNEFNFEPIREVAFIFIGIFGTMMPALELVAGFAQSEVGKSLINHNTLYWGTGIISGFLDNAPTYLNFFAAALAAQGGNIGDAASVIAFAEGAPGFNDSVMQLKAISIAAVFFGAMTYIGNGPNFMVKSISEQTGITMPSFFGYILRFSIPFLVPVLLVVWVVFFAFT